MDLQMKLLVLGMAQLQLDQTAALRELLDRDSSFPAGILTLRKMAESSEFVQNQRNAILHHDADPLEFNIAFKDDDVEALKADMEQLMKRLGPRWFLEQNWFPDTVNWKP